MENALLLQQISLNHCLKKIKSECSRAAATTTTRHHATCDHCFSLPSSPLSRAFSSSLPLSLSAAAAAAAVLARASCGTSLITPSLVPSSTPSAVCWPFLWSFNPFDPFLSLESGPVDRDRLQGRCFSVSATASDFSDVPDAERPCAHVAEHVRSFEALHTRTGCAETPAVA